jgi:hypothetical protein
LSFRRSLVVAWSSAILFACHGGGSKDGGASDADSGAPPTDGSVDAGSTDGPPQLGTMLLADPTAEIALVTFDETAIFFFQNGRIVTVPANGGPAADRGPKASIIPGSGVGDTIWVLTDLSGTQTSTKPRLGTLRAIKESGTSTAAQIAANVVEGFVAVGPDAERGLAGIGKTGTTSFDLYAIHSNGQDAKQLLSHLRPGPDCSMAILFVNPFRALVTACQGSQRRGLFFVDLEGQVSHPVHSDVLDVLIEGADHSFVLFLDSARHVFTTDLAGTASQPLAENEAAFDLVVLDGRRFAYRTSSGSVRVASFPGLTPGMLIATGAQGIAAVSPTGTAMMIAEGAPENGLVQLYLTGTATTTQQIPAALTSGATGRAADDPFSADGLYAYVLDKLDANLIGDADARKSDGSDAPKTLAPSASFMRTFQDDSRVLLGVNARVSGSHVAADLATVPRDGSKPASVIAPAIDTSEVVVFPATKSRVVYRITDDPAHLGIWVRNLPSE